MVSDAPGLATLAVLPAQGGFQTGPLRVRKASGLVAAAQVPACGGLQTGRFGSERSPACPLWLEFQFEEAFKRNAFGSERLS